MQYISPWKITNINQEKGMECYDAEISLLNSKVT